MVTVLPPASVPEEEDDAAFVPASHVANSELPELLPEVFEPPHAARLRDMTPARTAAINRVLLFIILLLLPFRDIKRLSSCEVLSLQFDNSSL